MTVHFKDNYGKTLCNVQNLSVEKTDDWGKVTCKRCIKFRVKYERSHAIFNHRLVDDRKKIKQDINPL